MRPPYFYPPSYTPTYVPVQRMSPFFMRPPLPVSPAIPSAPIDPATISQAIAPAVSSPLPLTGFLANAQSLFNQAQQFTPYFQQAAPMLKNLPALWRMYRSFKGNTEEESSVAAPPPKKRKAKAEPLRTQPSIPKIYQPPYDF